LDRKELIYDHPAARLVMRGVQSAWDQRRNASCQFCWMGSDPEERNQGLTGGLVTRYCFREWPMLRGKRNAMLPARYPLSFFLQW